MSNNQNEEKNIYEEAGVFSRLHYSWIFSIIKRGFFKPLENYEIPDLPRDFHSEKLHEDFKKNWKSMTRTISKEKYSEKDEQPVIMSHSTVMLRVLWRTFRTPLCSIIPIRLLSDYAYLILPSLVSVLLVTIKKQAKVSYFDGAITLEPQSYSLWIALLIFLSGLVYSYTLRFYFCHMNWLNLRIQSTLMSAIYEKLFHLSIHSKQMFSAGKVVNLIGGDVKRIGETAHMLHFTWAGMLQIIIVLISLFLMLGRSTLAGVAFMWLVVFCQCFLILKQRNFRSSTSSYTDDRLRVTREVMNHFSFIKLNHYEDLMTRRIDAIRQNEVIKHKKMLLLRAWITSINLFIPVITSIISFTCYYLLNEDLPPEVIFPSLSLFNQLKNPFTIYPHLATMLIDAKVALSRIGEFLLTAEVNFHPQVEPNSDYAIKVENGTFVSFEESQKKQEDHLDVLPISFQLKHVSLSIKRGQLVAIVGTLGSGKSSLLSCLIGQMKQVSASPIIYSTDSIYYASNAPLVLYSNSIKNNIVFSCPFNQEIYEKVLSMTQLEELLSSMNVDDSHNMGPNFPMSEHQRIGLARLLYYSLIYAEREKIFLLDGIFSYFDNRELAFTLFLRCICTELGQHTRIVVMDRIEWLESVDWVIYMNHGEIEFQGTVADLKIAKKELFEGKHKDKFIIEKREFKEEDSNEPIKIRVDNKCFIETGADFFEEKRKIGPIPNKLYISYFKYSGGWKFVLLGLSILIFFQFLQTATDLFITYWGRRQLLIPRALDFMTDSHWMGVYLGLGFLLATCIILASIVFLNGSIKAAKIIHTHALVGVLSNSDVVNLTKSGQILNRFSKDLDVIDEDLMEFFRQSAFRLAFFVGYSILITLLLPLFSLALIPVGVIYFTLQWGVRRTTRELNRLQYTNRSPYFALVSETYNIPPSDMFNLSCQKEGKSSIKAQFMNRHYHLLDQFQSPVFLLTASQQWLFIKLQITGNCLLYISILLCIFLNVSSSVTGLIMNGCTNLTTSLFLFIVLIVDLEFNMNSYERLYEYIEASKCKETGKEDALLDCFSKTEDLNIVTQPLSFCIKKNQRVALLSQTCGDRIRNMFHSILHLNGTSSLEKVHITLNGYPLDKLSLHALRHHIHYIQRESHIFTGTIRYNLDIEHTWEDAQLWGTIDRMGCKFWISALPGKLDFSLNENGNDLSKGQIVLVNVIRNLLMLKKNKKSILFVDDLCDALDVEYQQKLLEYFSSLKDLTLLINFSKCYEKEAFMSQFDQIFKL